MCENVNQVAWVTCDPLCLGQGWRGVCTPGMEQELCVEAGARLQPRGTPSPKSRAALVTGAGVSEDVEAVAGVRISTSEGSEAQADSAGSSWRGKQL